MGTLYRHFPAKEDLLREVCVESMRWATAAAEAALADADAWRGFTRFMVSCLESGVASLTHLAGSFKVNAEASAVAERCREVIQAVADRTHQQGPLRPGITAVDITTLLRQLQLSFSADRDRNQALRTRYLEVVLSGLCGTEPLPGTAVEWREDSARWEKGHAPEPG